MSSKHRLTRSFRTLSALLYIVSFRFRPSSICILFCSGWFILVGSKSRALRAVVAYMVFKTENLGIITQFLYILQDWWIGVRFIGGKPEQSFALHWFCWPRLLVGRTKTELEWKSVDVFFRHAFGSLCWPCSMRYHGLFQHRLILLFSLLAFLFSSILLSQSGLHHDPSTLTSWLEF